MNHCAQRAKSSSLFLEKEGVLMFEESKSVSRREFLKVAGIAGATIGAGAGLGGLVAACGGGETTTTTAAPATTTTAAAGYDDHRGCGNHHHERRR